MDTQRDLGKIEDGFVTASEKLEELHEIINGEDDPSGEYVAEQVVLEALPAFIEMCRAAEDLQANPKMGHTDWEGEVFAARYRVLRALSDLERTLGVGNAA